MTCASANLAEPGRHSLLLLLLSSRTLNHITSQTMASDLAHTRYTHHNPAHDEPSHHASTSHQQHRRIPPLPDLRFEYSYLRGVRSLVSVQRSELPAVDEKGKGVALRENDLALGGEVIHVQWGTLVWVTLRDQVISPLLQGALWYVSSPLSLGVLQLIRLL